MLSNYVLPQLQQHPDYSSLIFMQDGAFPHYANSVRNLLNTLPGGWISRCGTIKCPLITQSYTHEFFLVGCYEGPSLQQQTL